MTTAPHKLLDIARRHAAAEAAGDLTATLATLEAEPVYTFYPAQVGFIGMAATRRYYEHFFAYVLPRIPQRPRRSNLQNGPNAWSFMFWSWASCWPCGKESGKGFP